LARRQELSRVALQGPPNPPFPTPTQTSSSSFDSSVVYYGVSSTPSNSSAFPIEHTAYGRAEEYVEETPAARSLQDHYEGVSL
jgi:hypothetical protein